MHIMGFRRMLQLWRVLVACALLAVGAPAVASETTRAAITCVERAAQAPVQEARARRESPVTREDAAPLEETQRAPVERVVAQTHLHLRHCVLLC